MGCGGNQYQHVQKRAYTDSWTADPLTDTFNGS